MSDTSTALEIRVQILERLGGLPEPRVTNEEWLYMLTEETRHSIAIEGFFTSTARLKNVIEKNLKTGKHSHEILHYLYTARFLYGLAYENWKEGIFHFTPALIRQTNRALGFSGELRKGEVHIAGARITPPSAFTVKDWINLYADFTKEHLTIGVPFQSFLRNLAIQHALLEAIHPFDDGNGRTGRILLNYILVQSGLPPVVIKGLSEKDRKKYYEALEEADSSIKDVLQETLSPDPKKVLSAVQKMKTDKLETILASAIRESIDKLIIDLAQKAQLLQEKLSPLPNVAQKMGYSPSSMRKLVSRGQFIATKKGKEWFTSPELHISRFGQKAL